MSNKYLITCFDLKEEEQHFELQADDEAAALGLVLDEWSDEIARGSPFVVECAAALARRTNNGRRKDSRAKKTAAAACVAAHRAKEAEPQTFSEIAGTEKLPKAVRNLIAEVCHKTGCTVER